MSVNKVILVGRLGKDPEVKTISSGNQVCNFTMATSEKYKSKQGEWVESTQWHRIVVWGKQADLCGKYLTKGKQVYIEGRLETRNYENDKGEKVYVTEIKANQIQFLSAPKDEGEPYVDHTAHTENFSEPPVKNYAEELPF